MIMDGRPTADFTTDSAKYWSVGMGLNFQMANPIGYCVSMHRIMNVVMADGTSSAKWIAQ